MWPGKPEDGTPGFIDRTGMWRLVFWLTYVLGNVVLLFSFALAMVPPSRSQTFTLEYTIRLIIAGLTLVSILMATRI